MCTFSHGNVTSSSRRRTTKSDLLTTGFAVFAIVFFVATIAGAAGAQSVVPNLLQNTSDKITVKLEFGNFTSQQVSINGQSYTKVRLPGEGEIMETGSPALPIVSRSVIIPDDAQVAIRVLDSSYYEIAGVDVPPSKGLILRTVNPDNVPYTFGNAYQKDGFYPGSPAVLQKPYIMRDYRGVVITANPFLYNPVRHLLRVYKNITVEVSTAVKGGDNVLNRAGRVRLPNRAFRDIYKRQFINYAAVESQAAAQFAPLDEQGEMLIIVNDPWINNITPLADHKNSIGINTTVVGISAIGNNSANIKNYIQNVYNTSNLAYVLLVGDAAQVATPTASGGSSDPSYSKLAGSDNYPDIFVGRFSAETAADVDTQVQRTIEYENMPATQQDWFWRGVGIASPEGGSTTGDDGESDQQHIEGLRVALLGYGYTLVNQVYEAQSPTKADISNALNAGRGIINYCGHGSTTAWGTTGFSVTDVAALTNRNMLPFIFDVACVNGQFNGYTCFAEAWMRAVSAGEPTGAIGIYASSINQSWAPPMEAQDTFNSMYIAGTYSTYGALCYAGSCSMMDKYGTGGADMFNTWHIFGDPSLRIVGSVVTDNTIAQKPSPGNGAANVNTNVVLGWTPGVYAGSHDVYFGTDYNVVSDANYSSGEYKGNQPLDSNSFAPGILNYSTTYYWAIDEVNDTNIWPGNVWSFTTVPLPPGQATNPAPASGATGVGLTTDISWTAGAGATSHDVYFGTVNPPPFKVNQAGITYDTGTMSANTTYYWRIDEKNAGGTTTGTVWNFTTTTVAPAPTFVAAGAVSSGTGTITPALPAGISTGDILLLFLETSNQSISISNSNGGTWAAVTNSPQSTGTAAGSTGVRLTAFWSRYNGTQGAPTTSDSGDHQLGRIIAVRGAVASGNPWDVTAGGVEAASDKSGSIPGATTTVTNTLIVAAISTALPDSTGTSNFSSWTNSNLTSLTERTDNTTSQGNGGGLGIVTGVKATAGAYGNTAVTCASSSYKAMISIAIKP